MHITVNGITVTFSLDEDVETTDVLAATVLNYNGKATWNIINLPAGTYPAFAFYLGNENYTSVNTSDVFHVRALPSKIYIETQDIYVGEDEFITVTVGPSDATGHVTITVNGKQYTSKIVNGTATFMIPGLKAGQYPVVATYSGDDKYLPSNTAGKFNVLKTKPDISVDSPDINVGEDGTVTVMLPEDATGTVTIVIEGKTYISKVENGVAIFIVPGLNVGEHDIKVYYSGDDKYLPINTTGDINVLPVDNPDNHTSIKHDDIGLVKYPTGNSIALLFVVMLVGFIRFRKLR